ncbi:hypothetical protein ElyMa_001238800 [Elysia marginata]|uniref:Uncharacterized protein n=1 Tax=Elysia marginata TaxID=1093978 RepID=A0AAV4IDE4_9GAST|nr:hypothetical protein ElyMa_001238800 [Elysia marginata]
MQRRGLVVDTRLSDHEFRGSNPGLAGAAVSRVTSATKYTLLSTPGLLSRETEHSPTECDVTGPGQTLHRDIPKSPPTLGDCTYCVSFVVSGS